MKKKLGLAIILFLLVGCGKTNRLSELYEGMDAEETYEEMIDIMNKDITYYQQTSVHIENGEKRKGNGEVLSKKKTIYSQNQTKTEDGKIQSMFIEDDKKRYFLNNLDGKYSYIDSEKEKNRETIQKNILEWDYLDFISAKRKNFSDKIVIIINLKDSDVKEPIYRVYEFTIGRLGYLEKVKYSLYEDEDFSEKISVSTYKLSNYNEKKDIDIKQKIEELKELTDELVED